MNPIGPHTRGIARIFEQQCIARGYREISLSYAQGPEKLQKPLPGQFFTILPQRYPLSVMRRPFAYSNADEKGFTFIYEIRGNTTSNLADLDDGCPVDWIGPLGSSFPNPPEGSKPVLVAGGIGVGPIHYLARLLSETGIDSVVILGAGNAALVAQLDWPERVELRICTDDGSLGIHGTALDGLDGLDVDNAVYYSCGPRPMMAAVHQHAVENNRPCWVSMEEMMACGVGACQGCAVQVIDSSDLSRPVFKRVCVEGPIFDSREIVW